MSFLAAVRERRGFFLLSVAVIVLDQITKVVVHHYLAGRGAVEVIPRFFSLWYSRNSGGLFGSFRELPTLWRTLLLTILPAIAIAFIAGYLAKTRTSDRPTLYGLALILGGAVGNLIDRVIRGEVIDFLDVYVAPSGLADWLVARFGTAHWPTFNVADSAIVTGACLLILSIVRPGEPVVARDASSPSAGLSEPL